VIGSHRRVGELGDVDVPVRGRKGAAAGGAREVAARDLTLRRDLQGDLDLLVGVQVGAVECARLQW
jgi:hypothetical protein